MICKLVSLLAVLMEEISGMLGVVCCGVGEEKFQMSMKLEQTQVACYKKFPVFF